MLSFISMVLLDILSFYVIVRLSFNLSATFLIDCFLDLDDFNYTQSLKILLEYEFL